MARNPGSKRNSSWGVKALLWLGGGVKWLVRYSGDPGTAPSTSLERPRTPAPPTPLGGINVRRWGQYKSGQMLAKSGTKPGGEKARRGRVLGPRRSEAVRPPQTASRRGEAYALTASPSPNFYGTPFYCKYKQWRGGYFRKSVPAVLLGGMTVRANDLSPPVLLSFAYPFA